MGSAGTPVVGGPTPSDTTGPPGGTNVTVSAGNATASTAYGGTEVIFGISAMVNVMNIQDLSHTGSVTVNFVITGTAQAGVNYPADEANGTINILVIGGGGGQVIPLETLANPTAQPVTMTLHLVSCTAQGFTSNIGNADASVVLEPYNNVSLDVGPDHDHGQTVIPVNSGPNSNAIPGFADGYTLSGVGGNAVNAGAEAHFTIMTLSVSGPIDSSDTLTFAYSGSDPLGVTRTKGLTPGSLTYRPAAGLLRIWTRDASAKRDGRSLRSGGNYLTPGVAYTPAQLGLSDAKSSVTLYVEGISPSLKDGDGKVTVTLVPGGGSGSTGQDEGPPKSDSVEVDPVKAGLDVDTNRDGKIDKNDGKGKADPIDYTKPTGALVLADLSDSQGNGTVDAFNNVIATAAEAANFAPLLIHQMKLPAGYDVYLEVEGSGDQDVHIYTDKKVGTKAVIGPDPPPANGGPFNVTPTYKFTAGELAALAKGDLTFYVQGINPGREVVIDLNIYQGNKDQVALDDKVHMLVSPIILLSNLQPATKVFYSDWGAADALFTADIKRGAGASAQAVGTAPGEFVQDPFAIGYQRVPAPGGGTPITLPTALQLPYFNQGGQLKNWAKKNLLKPLFGVANVVDADRNPVLENDGPDFGGNIGVLPPSKDHPFGLVYVGSNMEQVVKDYLIQQKVQTSDGKSLIELNLKGVQVAHVDEVVNVIPEGTGFKVVIGDMNLAFGLLKADPSPAAKALLKFYKPSVVASYQKALDSIEAALTKAGVQASQFVHVPVLYPVTTDARYGSPNAANLQVINGKLLIPEQAFPGFTAGIKTNLTRAGIAASQIDFVNTTQLDARGGEAHCASNVERTPPKP